MSAERMREVPTMELQIRAYQDVKGYSFDSRIPVRVQAVKRDSMDVRTWIDGYLKPRFVGEDEPIIIVQWDDDEIMGAPKGGLVALDDTHREANEKLSREEAVAVFQERLRAFMGSVVSLKVGHVAPRARPLFTQMWFLLTNLERR